MQSRLYWHIHKLASLFEKKADEQLRLELGIGFAQYKVMEAINQNALTKQNTIAKLLDQTEASVSRQVSILQKKGLITVQRVMGNKRAKELLLTRVGEDICRQAEHVLAQIEHETVGELTYQEQIMFEELFSKMIEQTKKAGE
jgi:DNA-binding MarR family transcriptional regulator